MIRAEIEAALRRDLGDEQAWEVYGDLLSLEGDGHGELIALEQRAAASPPNSFQQRELSHRAELLFERERGAWLGPLRDTDMELQWTRGFITEALLARDHSHTLGELLELPAAALLCRLTCARLRSVNKLASMIGATPLPALDLRQPLDRSLAPLATLVHLIELHVDGGETNQLAALAPLALEHLELSRFEGGLAGLSAGFSALQTLSLTAPTSAGVLRALAPDALAPLSGLTQLQQLDLHDGGWSELSPLAPLTQLRQLDLRSTSIVSVAPLSPLTQLRALDLGGCANISDLDPLSGMRELQRLGLRYTRVRELRALRAHPRLESIDLSGTPISDLSPLFECTALRRVIVEACEIEDIAPLIARGVRVIGVRPPTQSWRELAAGLLPKGKPGID